MKNKKLINFLLCICLMVSMIPSIPASADSYVARVLSGSGKDDYQYLYTAIYNADGATVQLLADCGTYYDYDNNTSYYTTVPANTKIDLNGKKITSTGGGSVVIETGYTLTLTDNSGTTANPQSNVFSGEGTLVITGGTYSFDPTNYVPSSGYTVTNNGSSYTVTESSPASSGNTLGTSDTTASPVPTQYVTKDIEWDPDDPNNAKVTIYSSVPNVSDTQVLFLGTLCSAHHLASSTLVSSINAIAENANVRYYLLDKDTDSNIETAYLNCGEKLTGISSSMSTGNHASLQGFIDVLTSELITNVNNTTYDYIVLEFDSSRIADISSSTTLATKASAIAPVLREYYDENKVIWVTDGFDFSTFQNTTKVYATTPYTPTNEYYTRGDTTQNFLSAEMFRNLCAVFAPNYYLTNTTADSAHYGDGKTNFTLDYATTGSTEYCLKVGYLETSGLYAGHYASDSRQLYYDDASNLADFLLMAIQGSTLKFEDQLQYNPKTIKVKNVKLSATKDTGITDITSSSVNWIERKSLEITHTEPLTPTRQNDSSNVTYVQAEDSAAEITVTTDNVTASLNNKVTASAYDLKSMVTYAKLEVTLTDTAGFDSCITGDGTAAYVMNPNIGDADVTPYSGSGTEITTTLDYTLNDVDVYKITSTVTNGTQSDDSVYVLPGDDKTLTYTPYDGYSVDTVKVDGVETTDYSVDSDGKVTVSFEKVAANHTVDVVFSKPVTVSYKFVNAPSGVDSMLPESETAVKGSAYTSAETAEIKKPGYIFTGWYNEEACTSKYEDGTVINNDTTLYGKWESALSLEKTLVTVKSPICAGDTVEYKLIVSNGSELKVEGVTIADVLNDNLTYVTADNGGTYDPDTRTITWSNVTVPAGSGTAPGKTELTFKAVISNDIASATAISNTATGNYDGTDFSSAPVDITAIPLTRIRVIKNWSDGWDAHASDTVYVNVYADGVLKEKITLNSENRYAERSYPALDSDGKTINYTISEMASGSDDAAAVEEGNVKDGYKVSYGYAAAETAAGFNVYTITNTYIVQPEDIELKKSVSVSVAKAGDTITYTLTARNCRTNANETASNVVIEDVLPDGLTYVTSSTADTDKLIVDETNSQRYLWTIASIRPGETATLELTVKIPEGVTAERYANYSRLTNLNDSAVENGPVSNTVTTDVRSLKVTKVWYNSDGSTVSDTTGKPDITAVLYRNGARYSEYTGFQQILNASNNWTYTYEELPIYDSNGAMYSYTVSEETVAGYSTAVIYDEATKSDTYGYTQAVLANTIKTVTVIYSFVGEEENIPEDAVPPATVIEDYGTEYAAEPTAEYEAYAARYYYFSGWYSDPECTQKIDSTETITLNDQTAPGGVYNIYGKWIRTPVKVEVVEPDVGPENVTYHDPNPWYQGEGETPAVTAVSDPAEEYTFLGYYLSPDAETPVDVSTITLTKEAYPDGLKLYPRWVKNIDVTYTFVGTVPQGATEPDDEKVVPGTEYVSSKEYGSAEGYRFSGWYTDETLSTPYTDGTSLTENLNLYGKWTEIDDFTVVKDVQNSGESISGESILSNNTVTYFINVTNNNSACSKEVVLVDRIPDGLTYIDNISDSGTYNSVTGEITWKFILAGGGQKRVSFNATVSAGLSAVTVFTNNAYVSMSNGEPYVPGAEVPGPGSSDNPAQVSFTGIPVKRLTFTKVWSDGWDGHQSVVINIYANGKYFDSVYLDNAENKTQTLYVDAVDSSGESIVYTYRETYMDTDVGRGEMNGLYRFDYTESTDSSLAFENSALEFTNTYQIRPEDLTFTKTADPQALAGDTFVYTLTVTNNRAYETANNVIVEDALPDGLIMDTESTLVAENDTLVQDAANPQKYIWTIASIGPNETAVLKLGVTVPEGVNAAEYINLAEITSIGGTAIPESSRPSSEATTTVRNFTVTKSWLDTAGNPLTDTSSMPAISVTLLQNGYQYGDAVTLNSDCGWTYAWNLLPLYDASGTAYAYTVTESATEKYATVISYSKRSDTYGNAAAVIINTRKTVTVSYEYVGTVLPSGVKTPDSAVVEYGTQYISADKPSASSYKFIGWYLDEECLIPYTDGTELNDTTAPGGTLVLYGKWSRDTIIVNYQYVGIAPISATLPATVTLPVGTAYTSAGAQYVYGYKFIGWYLDPLFLIKYEEGTVLTSDTTLYGRWVLYNTSSTTYSGGAVKTGDDTNTGMYAIVCGLSAAACAAAVTAFTKSKKKKQQ